jgi:FMN reductase
MSVVVVGNPKPNSRTRAAAELVAEKLTGVAPEAKEIVKSADLLVVASPTFKATYTGLLKTVP